MYLKSIEVNGFKSFANKIVFKFNHGITCIVGPNGSGKSNVADAVRWVLGEQSAKQLRGGNMQDVIFSGTENRKPLSFASVSITLDNSDHKLPVDYNEVTVTRRLYRSGESEYLINGSGCRLKDIQEMFYDTGIGKEGYSIIGQGQIDKILSGKPEERRELFDEAAGIVKFKRRKATTLKKLDEERQNLVRVTDILSELTKQLGPLEKQSETARIYLAKREELKELDVNLFLLDHQRTGELLKELEEKINVNTRAVIVNTPHNPTGVVYSEETIQKLAAILEKKQKEFGTEIYLISDEPYRELAYDGVEVPYLTKYYANTVVGYSFSKSLSLPGERIGYLVIPDEVADSEKLNAAANVATRILGFVNAPTLQQKVVKACLNEKTDISYYDRNRETLYNGLKELGFECIKPEGAFYLFVKSPVADEKEFCNTAKKYNVLIVPGSSFGCPGYVRMAYCVAYETIVNALPKFAELAREYR